MSFKLRILFVGILFILLTTFPENLSRSASPHHSEALSPAEETQLYQFLMRGKVEKLDALMARYSWFNGNVMVVKNHKIIYQHAQGFANYLTREPLSTESVFELASVSKQFTAISILMLYERNIIDIDDPVHLLIPELPYQNITIRQLLHHTSGLPNYMWVLEHKWNEPHFPSNEEMLATLVKHHPYPFFWAGRRYNYSNTGYAVLASVVERATGQTFSQFLRENIFIPLNMHSTFTSTELLDSTFHLPNQALGHHRAWRRFKRNTPVVHDRVLGDKGVFSNLEDLYKWDQALYSENLLSNQTLELAYQPLTFSNRRSLPYGFGFRIGNRNGEKYVYHHGLWEGFHTSFIRHIETGNSIILLNNTNQQVNNQLVRQIQNILDEPVKYSPTQIIALKIIRESLEAGLQLFAEMAEKEEIVYPDSNELFEFAALLAQINKPELANRVFRFYETTSLCREATPELTIN
jgi:CubicO group peptidase (beta-lactamase class C family)